MKVLVFNCGSSSLKYRLLRMPAEEEIAGGEAQRVGPKTAEPSRILHRERGRQEIYEVEMRDLQSAFEAVMKLLARDPALLPDSMGHRMVHGGSVFGDHTVADAAVVTQLEAIQHLAPIHNPPATSLLKACLRLHPEVPQVVVFDTAYHATIPDYARTYALPRDVAASLGIRKYGFHGTSHNYVAAEAAALLGKPLAELNAVSCHLGSGGASLCAIVRGQSVDNTMGFSPLQGLMMSTRSGDLDPAVTLGLLAARQGDSEAVNRLLNKSSGVLGMSGFSADIRDVVQKAGTASPEQSRHSLTAGVYTWRIRKYLGAYLAVVGDADAILFTDTIGEAVPKVRWAVCSGMEVFGVKIDSRRNEECRELPADVAAPDSPMRILAIATNEELAIARHTYRITSQAA